MDARLQVFYVVLEILIAIVCCSGNLLVILAVWTCRTLRQQPTFCFMVSLATADFLVGAVAIPLVVLADFRVHMSFHVCVLRSCVEIMVTHASIHSLLTIAGDRFLRVYIPLRYRSLVTPLLSWAVVGVCWLSAAILAFIPMFGWYRHDTLERMQASNSTTIACTFLSVIPLAYMVYFNFFTCILPPLITMAALYFCIFMKMHQQLRGGGVAGGESHSNDLKERKLTRSLALVLLLFAITWLPLRLLDTAAYYGAHITHQGFYIGLILTHANSALNPLVYALRIQPIRSACWKLLKMHSLFGEPTGQSSRSQES